MSTISDEEAALGKKHTTFSLEDPSTSGVLATGLSGFSALESANSGVNSEDIFSVDSFQTVNLAPIARYIDTEFIKDSFFIELSPPVTRLEVMDSKESSRLLFFLQIVIVLSLIYSTVLMVLNHAVFVHYHPLQIGPSEVIEYKVIELNRGLMISTSVINLLFMLIIIVAFLIYLVHLRQSPTQKSPIQKILVGFVPMLLPFYIPFVQVYLLMEEADKIHDIIRQLEDGDVVQPIADAVYVIYTLGIVVFLMFLAGLAYSYTYTHGSGWSPLTFYLKRSMIIVVYLVGNFFGYFAFQIEFDFSTFAVFTPIIHASSYVPYFQLLMSWTIMALDLLLVFWVMVEIHITSRTLKSKTYMTCRTHRVGFQFFLYITSISFIPDYIFRLISGAFSYNYFKFVTIASGYVEYRLFSGTQGFLLMVAAYVLVQLYIHLPADVTNFLEFEKRDPAKVDVILRAQQMILKRFDTQDIETQRIYVHKKLLTLQNVVCVLYIASGNACSLNYVLLDFYIIKATMLNFSFLAYRYEVTDLPHMEPKDFEDHEHIVRKKIFDLATDTHVLIIESSQRIIVSFRGTKSFKNLETDINFGKIRMERVYDKRKLLNAMRLHETIKNGFHEQDIHESYTKLKYKAASIHRGFAQAYLAVKDAVIREVMDAFIEKDRQVFVTGHSLGGALATLFAFGLRLEYEFLPPVCVTTFGSPHVGNRIFADLYDNLVENHWRIVNARDLITKTPSGNYHPVGTLVLFTDGDGNDMFVDPSFFELQWFHRKSNSLQRHRLPLYYSSLASYLDRYHGEELKTKIGAWDIQCLSAFGERSHVEDGDLTSIID